MVRNQLIPTLGRQDLASHDNRACAENTQAPANSAKDPGLVKLPADEEPVFVIE
jgi:hypothetical protein